MRGRTFSFALLTILSSLAASPANHAIAEDAQAPVEAHAIPLYPDRPNELRADHLRYRGGLQLSSSDPRFGGLSDLAVSADGLHLLALSDVAVWFRADLIYDSQGDLAGLSGGAIAPMLNREGQSMLGKEGDAEGMTLVDGHNLNGGVLVSFEGNNRVWRYDFAQGSGVRPEPVVMGAWIEDLNRNQGMEAITLLPGNRLLALSEHSLDASGDIIAGLEPYPATAQAEATGPLTVVPRETFYVTSVARMPDDKGIYLLERRYSPLAGMGTEIRHIPLADIHPRARLEGVTLASLSSNVANIDNMEGMAVRRGPKGETFIYLISDDNYSILQRTLLLMFELTPD